MGSSTLITNDYDNVSGVLKNAIYGNGNTVAYTYDNLNRVTMKRLESNISDYVDTGTQNPEPEPEPEPEPNPDPEKPPVVDPNPKPDPEKPPIITEPHPEKPPLPPKIIDPGPVKPGIPLDPVEPPIEAMSLELENDEPSNNNIDATSNNYTKEIVSARYVYDNVGNLAKLVDSRSGITHKYTYDLSDRLVKTEDSNGNWFKYDYDKTNKTSKKENYIAGKSYSTSFEFDK
ncbi:RHS repeat domain-containing protein, partial [Clostridium sp.]|uniref:RHS repeat domain-containing protein n=1 Tax=Clostridium sp. TaxID=1506 RepID=UPI003217ABBD